jgi:hypothetical protein
MRLMLLGTRLLERDRDQSGHADADGEPQCQAEQTVHLVPDGGDPICAIAYVRYRTLLKDNVLELDRLRRNYRP